MGVSADEYLARAEEEGEAYVNAYEACYHECRIADGAFELLSWLEERGVHSMILSNHMQHNLDADVERLGITPYMKYISGNTERATITQGFPSKSALRPI